MEQAETLLARFGTAERTEVLRKISTGPLTFFYTQNGLRRLCWHGTELIRAIAWPIRDANWGTFPQKVISETIEEAGGLDARLTFSVGDGRLMCDLHIEAGSTGTVLINLAMTPQGGPFSTNRAGFTVLHPIRGIAGAPLRVTHADGAAETTVFPERIQPDQPVKSISGLSYSLDGQSVDIGFDGEVFEMEDQRNWSDASFKTYCVPLLHPFTYEISKTTKQSLRVQFSGHATSVIGENAPQTLRVVKSDQKALEIGVAVESGWASGARDLGLRPSHVVLRLSTGDDAELPELSALARDATAVELEIVLPDDGDVADSLKAVADAIAAQDIAPQRVIALRRCYLASHQPVGPWPKGPTPNDILPLVRAAFPRALVGGGMLTNFTEVNRCRPDLDACDYITHGLTPLVHAGDDMSVLETLETLPQIFASAETIAPGKAYRLGLVSIGMRSNPYGAAVAENPAQVRRTMARVDPRHRGLFGAAFAVGVLAATAGSKVEAICLGAPRGPFGLRYAPADYPQAGYDGTGRVVFPLFHVVRAACALVAHDRLVIDGLPEGIACYGATEAGHARLLLANLSESAQCVAFGRDARIAVLDEDTFDEATRREDWLDVAPRRAAASVWLPPFAVAFVEFEFPET